jgi:hypothetical protein
MSEGIRSPNYLGLEWTTYDSSFDEIQEVFNRVLKGRKIKTVVQEIKKRDGSLKTLDLAGQGGRMLEVGADVIVAVDIEFQHAKMQKTDRSSIIEITGDIAVDETWRVVKDHGPYNLITCTPFAGVAYIWSPEVVYEERQVDILGSVINRAVDQLSVGGVFLIETQNDIRAFKRYFKNQAEKNIPHPVKITYDGFAAMMITRLPNNQESSLEEIRLT